MRCSVCHDTGWICEVHRDQPFNHPDSANPDGRCHGAGMPCPNPWCLTPKDPPPLSGWTSIARVGSGSPSLRRAKWTGTPEKLSDCWHRSKGNRKAICVLFNHPFGWELRVAVDGELVRSEFFGNRILPSQPRSSGEPCLRQRAGRDGAEPSPKAPWLPQ
jgi:hypothetical protein